MVVNPGDSPQKEGFCWRNCQVLVTGTCVFASPCHFWLFPHSPRGLARPAPHWLTTAMSRHMRASSRLCIPEQRSCLVHSGPGAGGLGPRTPSKRSIALSKNLESGSERPSAYRWGRSQWPLAPCKKGPTQTSVSPRSWCSGATHRIRTDDLALTRRLLYRLS